VAKYPHTLFHPSGNDEVSQVLVHFSPYMPRSTTATVPRESHHFDSSVLASVSLTTSPTAFMRLTLLTASGLCVPPVAYMVLCVRFASIVHVCSSRNHLQRSAGHATLDTGGWLDLMETIFCLPVRDFHPDRNVKLRLPHQRRAMVVPLQGVATPPCARKTVQSSP
jgi:hypothetical protein